MTTPTGMRPPDQKKKSPARAQKKLLAFGRLTKNLGPGPRSPAPGDEDSVQGSSHTPRGRLNVRPGNPLDRPLLTFPIMAGPLQGWGGPGIGLSGGRGPAGDDSML